MMDGLDIEPINEIARSFWYHNALIHDDQNSTKLLSFAVMSWGNVTDRHQLEGNVRTFR